MTLGYNMTRISASLNFLLCIFLLIISSFSQATPQPLAAKQAFKFQGISIEGNQLVSHWKVAKHYYLYQDKFIFTVLNNSRLKLGRPQFPQTLIYKVYPGGIKMKAHTGKFNVSVPFNLVKQSNSLTKIKIEFQGCSDEGLCYPPQTQITSLSFAHVPPGHNSELQNPPSQQATILDLLKTKGFFAVVAAFFIMGIFLSLTPCVLPMIPILSSILAGQKKITHLHAFLLSLTYVFAMALTYAIIGVAVGLAGAHLQAALQTPWVISLFALVFVLMALSLFGLYHIELPASFRHQIARLSEHQKQGTYVGTFIMGVLATLILSPCVTPALAGAIIYIGNQGNALLGASSLFSMGVGMGIPLLALGAFGPMLLPRTGPWMNVVKYVFGVLMLALAIYTLSRILPASITMALWGTLAVGTAIALGSFHSVSGVCRHVGKYFGLLLFIYGILIFTGALLGETNPLKPISLSAEQKKHLDFKTIYTLAELKAALKQAQTENKPVLLDFYAKWCRECLILEDTVFKNQQIKKLTKNFIVLRADVSKNNESSQALLKYFQLYLPPAILFFTPSGKEVTAARQVGSIHLPRLIRTLQHLNKNPR